MSFPGKRYDQYLERQARIDAAWREHVAATGHADADQGTRDISCCRCAWYYIDDTPPMPQRPGSGDGWAPGASTFVRDADEMRMARP